MGFNFRISGGAATADEWLPAVAYNSTANQYLVVWQDRRGRGDDIYGQRVSAAGQRFGSNFRISGAAARCEDYPAVAYSPTANQYLVVWQDCRNMATHSYDIYGRRVGGKATDRVPRPRRFAT